MPRVLWFLNRAVAGIVAATMTGLIFSAVSELFSAVLGRPDPASDFLSMASYEMTYGTIVGGPLGIIVTCFSRARFAPWRSLPTLIVGTSIGYLIGNAILFFLPYFISFRDYVPGALILTACATIGGVIASFFLPKQKATSLDSVS